MNDPYDEIPLPSKGVLSEEETAKQLREDMCRQYVDGMKQLRDQLIRLRGAIATHRAQKADDRCIEDDDRLYEALGDGIKCDRRVGDKEAMLWNCRRFIEQRCEGGGWPSYAELESDVLLHSKLRVQLVTALRLDSLPPRGDNSRIFEAIEKLESDAVKALEREAHLALAAEKFLTDFFLALDQQHPSFVELRKLLPKR